MGFSLKRFLGLVLSCSVCRLVEEFWTLGEEREVSKWMRRWLTDVLQAQWLYRPDHPPKLTSDG